jgi:adenylate cyclase
MIRNDSEKMGWGCMSISSIAKFRVIELIKFAFIGGAIGVAFSIFTAENDYFILFSIGFIGALLINLANQVIDDSYLRKLPFLWHTMVRMIIYMFIVVLTIFAIACMNYYFEDGISITEGIKRYYYRNIVQTNDFMDGLSYAVISAFILTFFTQLNLLIGRGRVLKYIRGKYYKPLEEERIVMFLDISDSTTIAEKIGHIKYSNFVKDFIYELHDAVLITEAEIVQYVGDELLLMWTMKKGLKNNNCLKMYFLAKEQIEKRKDAFIEKYGYYPRFKAGLHSGKMIITEVGSLKKEIAHYGDSMNTAARIRSTCNDVHRDLLVSENLLEKLNLNDRFKIEHLGSFSLKGKKNKVKLAAVEMV